MLHLRHRKVSASAGWGGPQFLRELIGRAPVRYDRPGDPAGRLGVHSKHVVAACRDHDARYSVTVNQNKGVVVAIEAFVAVDEATWATWATIDYTAGGEASVSECPYGDGHRLVVRRTRFHATQAELLPFWRYHAFLTDRIGSAVDLDADHRHPAVVELAIRDLKEGTGLFHCPSGEFDANVAWAVLATIALNMLQLVSCPGLDHQGPVVAKTFRRKSITIPGRPTHRSRWTELHLPSAHGHGPPSGRRASTAYGHCQFAPDVWTRGDPHRSDRSQSDHTARPHCPTL